MSDDRTPGPGARWPKTAALAAGLVVAAQLAVGAPGHAANLPITSEKLTVDIVGNPP